MTRVPTRPIDHRTVLGRRRLLAGLGALTVALTRPIWRPGTAFGQDATSPGARRFIGIFSANGTVGHEFFPAHSGSEGPLGPDGFGRILQPLSAHASRMLVLEGVDMVSTVSDELGTTSTTKPGGPHMKGPGAMLTGGALLPGSFGGAGGPAGYADRISVDQFIANRIGTETAFPSLEFGARVGGGAPLNTISYRGPNQPNTPIDDPVQMYSRMFANSNLGETELARLIEDRKSVLDFVGEDIAALKPRLAAEDRSRLDSHLTGIRTIEQQLSARSTACTPPEKPSPFDGKDQAAFEPICKVQLDLMLLAHTCGLTRVSTFMFANADSWQYFPFAGVNEEHHELSHCSDDDATSIEKLVKINVWHAQQVNYLLDRLAAATEVDGSSLLENTVVLWGNELGVGNSHDYRNIPWLLAGGSKYFRTGRVVRFDHRPHNDLLVSICNAMGFADVTSFGIPGVCTGALPGLTA